MSASIFMFLLSLFTVVAIASLVIGGMFAYSHLERIRAEDPLRHANTLLAICVFGVTVGAMIYTTSDGVLVEAGMAFTLGFAFFGTIIGLPYFLLRLVSTPDEIRMRMIREATHKD